LQRVGSDREHRVDVRLIVATNRDLAEEVKRGHFRADFYHRLSVFPIRVPALRERGRDVLLLAGYFLEENRARLGLTSLRLSADAQRALLDYPWPGNIRELEHLVGRSALRALAAHKTRPGILTLDAAALELHAPETAAQPGAAVPEQGGQAQALSLREQAASLSAGWWIKACSAMTATSPPPPASWGWIGPISTGWPDGWACAESRPAVRP
jgi:anaerobic nitric oxide reductase transcription regulator